MKHPFLFLVVFLGISFSLLAQESQKSPQNQFFPEFKLSFNPVLLPITDIGVLELVLRCNYSLQNTKTNNSPMQIIG